MLTPRAHIVENTDESLSEGNLKPQSTLNMQLIYQMKRRNLKIRNDVQ
jgi:hypothetical protein